MDSKPAPTPVMDVVTAPPAERREPPPKPAETPKPPAAKAAPKPKAPRQAGDNVGKAIFATMVIVLVLATLATYAYLQSH